MRDHNQLVGTVLHDAVAGLTVRDTLLYALALGYGSDPLDPHQLAYVYEDGLRALPGMAMIVGYPGFWMRDPRWGFNWQQVLHAEEAIDIHHPLPVAGRVRGRTVVEDVVDRGADKGCFVYLRKDLYAADGVRLATVTSNTLARADGGSGGNKLPLPAMPAPPARAADAALDCRPCHRPRCSIA